MAHDSGDTDSVSLEAAEVMQMLGIKQQTLYAYASRGLLRKTSATDAKRSRYARDDVERLLARKLDRQPDAAPSAHAAMAAPSGIAPPGSALASAITDIGSDSLRYRGRDVRLLAAYSACIENVAELLWFGLLPDEPVVWDYDAIPPNLEAAIAALQRGDGKPSFLRAIANASLVLGESTGTELRLGNTARLARRLVMTYAGCLGYGLANPAFVRPLAEESLVALVVRALGIHASKEHRSALNATLIWCADHELSAPAYTARVIAATGAGLHACLIGAISAQSGSMLGGGCDRTEEFIRSQPSEQRMRELIAPAKHGARLPGFGHALYPQGDPRALALLELARSLAPPQVLDQVLRLQQLALSEAGLQPSLELGLVAMALALQLPPRSAANLWAVARSIGWVAHVIEQRLSGSTIRPRARKSAG